MIQIFDPINPPPTRQHREIQHHLSKLSVDEFDVLSSFEKQPVRAGFSSWRNDISPGWNFLTLSLLWATLHKVIRGTIIAPQHKMSLKYCRRLQPQDAAKKIKERSRDVVKARWESRHKHCLLFRIPLKESSHIGRGKGEKKISFLEKPIPRFETVDYRQRDHFAY